jgi:hypothetical protein
MTVLVDVLVYINGSPSVLQRWRHAVGGRIEATLDPAVNRPVGNGVAVMSARRKSAPKKSDRAPEPSNENDTGLQPRKADGLVDVDKVGNLPALAFALNEALRAYGIKDHGDAEDDEDRRHGKELVFDWYDRSELRGDNKDEPLSRTLCQFVRMQFILSEPARSAREEREARERDFYQSLSIRAYEAQITTLALTPAIANCSRAFSARCTSEPVAIRMMSGREPDGESART